MDTHSVAPPGPQVSAHSRLSLTPKEASENSRGKVCVECGDVFSNPLSYAMHVRTHQSWLECDKCPFKTKLLQKLQWHEVVHIRNPDQRCIACPKVYNRTENLIVHQKKIHGIYQCRFCGNTFADNDRLRNHMQEVYNKTGTLPSCWEEKIREDTIPAVPQTMGQSGNAPHPAGGRVRQRGKMLVSQHVEVPVEETARDPLPYTSVFVKQEKESYEDSSPSPPSSDLSSFPATTEPGELPQQHVQVVKSLDAASPISLLIYNPMSQPVGMIRPQILLQPRALSTANQVGNLNPLTLTPQYVSRAQALTSSSGITTFAPAPNKTPKTNTSPISPFIPLPNGAPVPAVTPCTSSENVSQRETPNTEGLTRDSLFCCKLCPCAFLTLSDFKKHHFGTHSDEPFPSLAVPWIIPKKRVKELKFNVASKPREPKQKQTLPCNVCQEVFFSLKQLAKHKKLKHRKEYECSDCDTVARTHSKLIRHQKMFHKNKFRCRYFCGKLFTTREEVISHYKEVHKKIYTRHECPHCQRSFLYEAFLMNHLEKCQECPPDKRPAHVCGNCEGFFSNIEAYNEHAVTCLPTLKEKKKRRAPGASLKGGRGKTQKIAENVEASEPEENQTETTDQAENSDSAESDDFDIDAGIPSSDEDLPGTDAPTPSTDRQSPPQGDYKKCRYCPYTYFKDRNAVGHILNSHTEMAKSMMVAPLMCDLCGQLFKLSTCLCKHLMKHYSKQNKWDAFVPRDILKLVKVKGYCWICCTHQDWQKGSHDALRDVGIDEALEIEELINTEMEPLKCDKCDELFPTRKMFWQHVREHLANLPEGKVHFVDSEGGSRLFECRKCQFKCSDRDGLYRHLLDHFLVKGSVSTQLSKKGSPEPEDVTMDFNKADGEGDAEVSRETDLEASELLYGRQQKDMNASGNSDMEASKSGDVEGCSNLPDNCEED